MLNPNGTTLAIDGLWALRFGNDGNAGPANTLFFTAGPNGEVNGLLGTLTPIGVPPLETSFGREEVAIPMKPQIPQIAQIY